MEIEKQIAAIKLCGSTPRADQCKQCAYWNGGDMGKCIPRMTEDAATALEQLQAENGRLKRERDAAVNDYRVLPEKCVCMTTCGGKKIAIVLDVEAVKETAHD